jgi:ribosomal protein L7/L12
MKREPTEEEHEKITQAIFAGDRTEAISLYISIKACGLTDAQDYIKKLTAEMKETQAEKFIGKQQKKRIFGNSLLFSVKK